MDWEEKMDRAIDSRNFGYFQIFNSVLDPDLGLNEIDFFIYAKICRHAGNGPTAYFSLGKLKQHMKWGNTTVSDSIKKLQKVGLIEADRGQKGYLFTLVGSVANFMNSPTGKAEFPPEEHRTPPTGNKEYTLKNTQVRIEKGAATPPSKSNELIKVYMDKQLEYDIPSTRPSPAEIGMIKTITLKGVSAGEFGKMIDVAWPDKRFSVDYLLRDSISLRAKAAEGGKVTKEGKQTFAEYQKETIERSSKYVEKTFKMSPEKRAEGIAKFKALSEGKKLDNLLEGE